MLYLFQQLVWIVVILVWAFLEELHWFVTIKYYELFWKINFLIIGHSMLPISSAGQILGAQSSANIVIPRMDEAQVLSTTYRLFRVFLISLRVQHQPLLEGLLVWIRLENVILGQKWLPLIYFYKWNIFRTCRPFINVRTDTWTHIYDTVWR